MTIGIVSTSFNPEGDEGQVQGNEGDKLEVRFDYGDGWCEVIGNDSEGIFPTAYLHFPDGNPPLGPADGEDVGDGHVPSHQGTEYVPYQSQFGGESGIHQFPGGLTEDELHELAVNNGEESHNTMYETDPVQEQLKSELKTSQAMERETSMIRDELERDRRELTRQGNNHNDNDHHATDRLSTNQQRRFNAVLTENNRLEFQSSAQKESFKAREHDFPHSHEDQSHYAQELMAERERSATVLQELEQMRVQLQHAQASQTEVSRALETERLEHGKSRSNLESELSREQQGAAQLIEDAFNNAKREKEQLELRLKNLQADFEKKQRDEILKRESQSQERAKLFMAEKEKGGALQRQYELEKQAHSEEISSLRIMYDKKLEQANMQAQQYSLAIENQKKLMEAKAIQQTRANRASDRKQMEETLASKRVEFESLRAADLQEVKNAKASLVEEKGRRETMELLLMKEKKMAQKQRDELSRTFANQYRALQSELDAVKKNLASTVLMRAGFQQQVEMTSRRLQQAVEQNETFSKQINGQNGLIVKLTSDISDLKRSLEQEMVASKNYRLQAEAEASARKRVEAEANVQFNQQNEQILDALRQYELLQSQQMGSIQQQSQLEADHRRFQTEQNLVQWKSQSAHGNMYGPPVSANLPICNTLPQMTGDRAHLPLGNSMESSWEENRYGMSTPINQKYGIQQQQQQQQQLYNRQYDHRLQGVAGVPNAVQYSNYKY